MVIKGLRLKKEGLGRKNKSCTVCATLVRGVSVKVDTVVRRIRFPQGNPFLFTTLYTGFSLSVGPWMKFERV